MNQSQPAPVYSDKQLSIIRAAEELFAKNGFDGTSVRDIAQHANVNVAMISYYFGSKEALFESIVTNRMASSGMMLESLLIDEKLTPWEKMKTVIDTYVDRIMEHPFYHKIIMRQQLANMSKGLDSPIVRIKLRNMSIIKKIIQEGIKKKMFIKNVDVPLLYATLFGVFHQVINNESFYRHLWNMEDLSEDAFKLQVGKKMKIHLKYLLQSALTNHAY
jgi:AcrR family transcriptional regulator